FSLYTSKFLNHPRQDQKLPELEDQKETKEIKDLEDVEAEELLSEEELPTEEEALQQALQKNALKENHVYTIDTLIPYEEYALEKTDTVNVGPLTKEQG